MIAVRPAVAEDAETFLALIDALADYEKLARPTADARARLIRDGFSEPRRFHPYMAELDGQPVGYAITYFTYSSFLALPTLYLEDLFVLPGVRRKGVGSEFFRFLAGEAVRQGCGRMEWAVLEWNQLAMDFYERLGSTRLSDWYTYRLTAAQLRDIAGEG